MTRYWLIKSEPETYSIDDLERDRTTSWEGVRNFQARNLMREMKKGDLAFFYHSGANPPAIVGLAKIVKEAHPDPSSLKKTSHYFDPRATPENPIWDMIDIAFTEKFSNAVTLPQLKADPNLDGLMVTRKGSRLSVQPVSAEHYQKILNLAQSL